MASSLQVVIVLAVAGLCASAHVKATPPTFNSTYIINGVLRLPYAEINEPFTAYFDSKNNRSRIDYYGGSVVTILRADVGKYGITYKLAPMSNYTVNTEMCFQTNGTNDTVTTIQSILPDLTGFKFSETKMLSGVQVDLWMKRTVVGTKENVYVMYTDSKSKYPVRYEMMGYDTLLGSHYDKYSLDYESYKGGMAIQETTFETPKNLSCGGFPGPGVSHHLNMNPMREFIHHDDSHTNLLFDTFKKTHKRSYVSDKEHAQRTHIFRQNVRFIYSKNRNNLSYHLSVNHMADRTDEEMKLMNGYHYTPGNHGGLPFDKTKYNLKDVPDQVDWRLFGAVTPVKDQAVCGSCWSFGTTGTIEGANFLKTGNLVRLSQQELMDCSWGEGNNACDGGEDFRSYMYIMKTGGLTSEEQYGPYLGADGTCHGTKVSPVVQLSGYVNVTPYDQEALRVAIANEGPVSVSIDASHKSLSFYANGVYYEPACGSDPDSLDHSVLAVGYGVMNNQAYWLIKNSWSTYWGNDGYVLMAQKDNNCGVATAPTFVNIK
ncbi:digestive cysteine proteinase 1-like [Haliotis rufescens]|uniref:digestive cysteine proteinase 1-like n=1 Tax=Haliotis rufescens TaxID=6454 RepID=UPI00201ECF3A|nr:digestive cysteine proteinase 1-like [Haliotis rufescens]